jgi:hypothetical protein
MCSEWDFLKGAIVDTKELTTVEVRHSYSRALSDTLLFPAAKGR